MKFGVRTVLVVDCDVFIADKGALESRESAVRQDRVTR